MKLKKARVQMINGSDINANFQGQTILIADDELAIQTVLSDYFRDSGLKLIQVKDGDAAVIKAINDKPDLILLDVMMPGMNGFETCREIKSYPELINIPVIFMTGLTDLEAKIKGFEAGAVDFISKPIQYEELLARVKTHITLKTQREKLEMVNQLLEQKVQERTQQLHKLLDDKNLLLQEMNHRVRNNLQILSSLLSLQSAHYKNKQIKDFVSKYSHRIQTMSIAHDMIDANLTMLSIPFKHYLYNLISQLIRDYHQSNSNVLLRLNMDNCRIDINAALPCGLIINELVTNVLKYAIPVGEKGSITISYSCSPDQMYVLELTHDGHGFKASIDFQKQLTLGLKLVKVLTNQLKGTIDYDPTTQTYRISFKKPDMRSYNLIQW